MLGSRGLASWASTGRDKPRDIDIPDLVYEGTRTCEHDEIGPSARYHLFLQADDITVLSQRESLKIQPYGLTFKC